MNLSRPVWRKQPPGTPRVRWIYWDQLTWCDTVPCCCNAHRSNNAASLLPTNGASSHVAGCGLVPLPFPWTNLELKGQWMNLGKWIKMKWEISNIWDIQDKNYKKKQCNAGVKQLVLLVLFSFWDTFVRHQFQGKQICFTIFQIDNCLHMINICLCIIKQSTVTTSHSSFLE